jgi:hypothetical protein
MPDIRKSIFRNGLRFLWQARTGSESLICEALSHLKILILVNSIGSNDAYRHLYRRVDRRGNLYRRDDRLRTFCVTNRV